MGSSSICSSSSSSSSSNTLNKAFEEKTNLHADNALANDVDNMPAIVSCVGRIHPSLLKFMYEQLTFHAKRGAVIHLWSLKFRAR